jgi:hypothetical protein
MPLAHDVPVDRATIVRASRAAFASCLELGGVPAGYAKSGDPGGNELFAGYFAWMNELGETNTGHTQLAGTQSPRRTGFSSHMPGRSGRSGKS